VRASGHKSDVSLTTAVSAIAALLA